MNTRKNARSFINSNATLAELEELIAERDRDLSQE